MTRSLPDHVVIVGGGAAGLMAARELARAGKRVTLLDAQERLGGRIQPLPAATFGYPAEGGAEFIHGEAPVTRALLREAGLSDLPLDGTRWTHQGGRLSDEESRVPHQNRLHAALQELKDDMTVAEFLRRHFAGTADERLRQSIERMVEGYDAADPERASVFALRDEWMGGDESRQTRIADGYGPLVAYLAAQCRDNGVAIHLGAVVSAIEAAAGKVAVRCANGSSYDCDAAILTVPLPLLEEIELPPQDRARAAAARQIGFGNVIKILVRFDSRWWVDMRKDLADLTFLISDQSIPVWWTQHPVEVPVLTGWFGGPRTEAMADLDKHELVAAGLASLAEIFGVSRKQLPNPVAAQAINWSHERFARGAYSYATPDTRAAQERLSETDGDIFFSGEALYRGRDMGTVEAALASGLETARIILRR